MRAAIVDRLNDPPRSGLFAEPVAGQGEVLIHVNLPPSRSWFASSRRSGCLPQPSGAVASKFSGADWAVCLMPR
jgi:hypothetical protein